MEVARRLPSADVTAVPLSVVLARVELALERIAGPAEDRPVAMVQASELDDPAQYLLGGELLLTAGVHFPASAEAVDAYVRRVAAAGVAALGFGVAPVHPEVPRELVAACERYGLPLLRVPPQTPFVAVGRAVYAAMAEARSRDLRRLSQAQAALASAAARPDAVEAVLRQLAARLGAWAVLLDGEGRELFAAGARPGSPVPERLRSLAGQLAARSARTPGSATEHHAGAQLVVHTLAGESLLGLAAGRPLTSLERSVAGVGVVLLSLLSGPRHALGGDTRSAAAMVRVLLGAEASEVAPLLHPAESEGRWVVVCGRRTGRGEAGGAVHLAALGTALGTPYLEVAGEALRAVVPLRGREAEEASFALPERLGWTLGVSGPVVAGDLGLAAAQAERALRRALAVGSAVLRHREAEPSVHGLVAPGEAEALARARFAALREAGPPGEAVLLETLRTWLSLHGSWDRTAVALDLHRNTVRQRIARIGGLLEVDLADADVRMELWFALRWLPEADDRG